MLQYILGCVKNIFNPAISLLALVDNCSIVSKKARVWKFARVYKSTICSYSYISPSSVIICAKVGRFCSIADHCTVGIGNHSLKNISTSPIFYSKHNGTGFTWTDENSYEEFQQVTVGNDVWIGTRVIVMGGLTIGDGAIIGAGSIVTKDIPPYAIAVGIPAKVIKYRFEQSVIDKLLEIQWWNMSEELLKNRIALFRKSDFTATDLETI